MAEQYLTSIIAKKFYLWFLTLCFTTVAIIFITNGEMHNIWYDKMIGGLTLTPLALPMKLIFTRKIENDKLDHKLAMRKERNEYKLKKLKIRKGLI